MWLTFLYYRNQKATQRNQKSNEKCSATKITTQRKIRRNQTSNEKSNATQPKKQAKNARQCNQKTKQAIVLWVAYNNQKTNELEAVLIIVLT